MPNSFNENRKQISFTEMQISVISRYEEISQKRSRSLLRSLVTMSGVINLMLDGGRNYTLANKFI